MTRIITTSFILIVLFQLTAMAQQNVQDSLLHQDYQRKYIVHLPSGYTGDTAVAAVLTLHGGSGDMYNVQGFTQMNNASNQKGFLAVYPQGIGEAPPGYSWADGRGTTADDAGIDDVGFLDKLIDKLADDYNVDKLRVYVCGFSNGGFMTQRLACELSDHFAAIGGLGCSLDSTLYANCSPSTPVPMMYVSGTNDPEVPYNGGYMNNPAVEPIVAVEDAVQYWVDHNNCSTEEPVVNIPDYIEDDSSTVDMYDYTDCDAGVMVRFFKVNNGGHTWPGVEIPDMEPLLGETNEDIHASFQLWNFFKEYSLSEIPTEIDEAEKLNYEISVYPNPLTDNLILESSEYFQNFYIYNNTGILLNSGKIALKKREVVDVSDLSKGFYILKMVLEDNSIVTRKLVK